MDDETTQVSIPVSPIGVQQLCSDVQAATVNRIVKIHTGIPQNQLRSIIACVIKETVDQLVSATKDLDNE